MRGPIGAGVPVVKPPVRHYQKRMVNRGEILWLGIASGVMGCLIGGMMLGIGLDLIVEGQPLGWLMMLPGAPVSAIPGWLLARKLARQLPASP